MLIYSDKSDFPPTGSPRGKRPRSGRRITVVLLLLVLLLGVFLGYRAARPLAEGVRDFFYSHSGDGERKVPWGDEDNWNLRLVNSENPLPADFEVPQLTELQNGQAIDSRAYAALQQMMDDCRKAGLSPLICSSYRTRATQETLFQNKLTSLQEEGYTGQEADAEAALWVARPGTSEHELGLAVDIVDTEYQLLDRQQENTPVQQWLMTHCADYGFILRYPTGKSDITGIGYEPWHYRYVGQEAAKEIMEQGLCLEEYLGE